MMILAGITFPLYSAAQRDFTLRAKRMMALDRAERMIQERPATLTVLLHSRSHGVLSPPRLNGIMQMVGGCQPSAKTICSPLTWFHRGRQRGRCV